jgi:serine O-acetyltransferase
MTSFVSGMRGAPRVIPRVVGIYRSPDILLAVSCMVDHFGTITPLGSDREGKARLCARAACDSDEVPRWTEDFCMPGDLIHRESHSTSPRLTSEPIPSPSPIEPDWTRERLTRWWDPSRQLLGALRDYARAQRRTGLIALLARQIAVLRHRFWSVVSGADIPLNTYGLGGGLLLPHPQGVVIHPDAQVGPNCLLLQQVTIGTGTKPGVPTLGGHVDVGAGAKLLGGIVIGEHAVIGANAVVVTDVPADCVAVGVPAVSKRKRR